MRSLEDRENRRVIHLMALALYCSGRPPLVDKEVGLSSRWLGDARITDPMWEVIGNVVVPLRPEESLFGNSPEEKYLKERREALSDPQAFMLMVPNRTQPGAWVFEVVRPQDIMRKHPEDLLSDADYYEECGDILLARSLQVAFIARTGRHDIKVYPNVK